MLKIEVAKNADIQDTIEQRFEMGVGTQDIDELQGAEEALSANSHPCSSHHFQSVMLRPKAGDADQNGHFLNGNEVKAQAEDEANFIRFMKQAYQQSM